MPGAFGLLGDDHHRRVPRDLMVEANPRLDVFWLHQIGALTEGATIELAFGDTVGGPPASCGVNLRREVPNLWINETRVTIVWDEPMPGVGRPWFLCACGRRARYLYFRDTIACARCHGLVNASDHLRRQTRGVGRVERLRRKLGDCEPKPFARLPAAPRRGRSRAYHERLVTAIQAEEAALLDHLGGVVRDLKRRIRVRRERGKW